MEFDSKHLRLYITKILKELPNLPPDVSTSFMLSHEKQIQELYGRIKGPFCSNCSCPWAIGCNRMRLWPPPRKTSAIGSMKRRENAKRISRKEKTLLSMAENKQNALVIKCKICDFEMVNKFDLPENIRSKKLKQKDENGNDVNETKKKKKKKKNKEKNAGLRIPSEAPTNKIKSKNIINLNKKNKKSEEPETASEVPKKLYNNINTEQTQTTSASRPLKSKVTRLKLSSCPENREVEVKKKKPSMRMTMNAMKMQNYAFMQQRKMERNTLNLDSFLGSLI